MSTRAATLISLVVIEFELEFSASGAQLLQTSNHKLQLTYVMTLQITGILRPFTIRHSHTIPIPLWISRIPIGVF